MGCAESSLCSQRQPPVQTISATVPVMPTPSAARPPSNFASKLGFVASFHDKYDLVDKIGEGAFGQVYRATSRAYGRPIFETVGVGEALAVKVMEIHSGHPQSYVEKEVSAWRQASGHKNIVQLHEVFLESDCCYLVMEQCACSVIEMLAHADMHKADVVTAFRGMIQGLDRVHNVGVVHRDVKPDNFLLGGPDGKTVKLADFGLAALMPSAGKTLQGVYGTAPYMSPEMVRMEAYDFGTDMWSLGVVAYFLMFEEFPFGRDAKTSETMKTAIIRSIPPSYKAAPNVPQPPQEAVEFIRSLLVRQPDVRPSAAKALKLPFVTQFVSAMPSTSHETASSTDQSEFQHIVRKARKITTHLQMQANHVLDPLVQDDFEDTLQCLRAKCDLESIALHPLVSSPVRCSCSGATSSLLTRESLARYAGALPAELTINPKPLVFEDDGQMSCCSKISDASTASGDDDGRITCMSSHVPTLDSLPSISAVSTWDLLPPLLESSADDCCGEGFVPAMPRPIPSCGKC